MVMHGGVKNYYEQNVVVVMNLHLCPKTADDVILIGQTSKMNCEYSETCGSRVRVIHKQ